MSDNNIVCTTAYNEDACRALVHLMLGKLRRWPRYALILTGIVTSVAAGMLMVMQGSVSALPFLCMIVGSMLCTVGFYLETVACRMLVAVYHKGYPSFEFSFSEEEIRIIYADHEIYYSYAYVYRLIEMSGYLFMFMHDGQMYMIRQSDVPGNYLRLKELLNQKCAKPDASSMKRH